MTVAERRELAKLFFLVAATVALLDWSLKLSAHAMGAEHLVLNDEAPPLLPWVSVSVWVLLLIYVMSTADRLHPALVYGSALYLGAGIGNLTEFAVRGSVLNGLDRATSPVVSPARDPPAPLPLLP